MAQQGFGGQTWPHEFTPAIADYFGDTFPGFTRDRVFASGFTVEDHLRFPPSDRFVTLFFPDFPVDQTMVTGGGTYNTAFDSRMEATVFIRLESDIENRSPQQIENEALGVYKLLQDLLTAAQMWNGPVGTDNRSVFRRPMRTTGFRIQRKSGHADSRWMVSIMSFEVSFVSELGTPYPGG
jgi:hypothetical protein